jgi:tetratricopeptide (TPR) repeat protein
MTAKSEFNSDDTRLITRPEYLKLLAFAISCKSTRFARQTALAWLAVYPGDLQMQTLYARALMDEDRTDQAIEWLEKVCQKDPEYLDAQQLLAAAYQEHDPRKWKLTEADVYALGGEVAGKMALPEWSVTLHEARNAKVTSSPDQAYSMVQKVLGADSDPVLVATKHLEASQGHDDLMTVKQLAEIYHTRWPDCLQFTLRLADAKMHAGDESGAVELLHYCVNSDAGGQVAERMWGVDHAYKPLWPDRMEVFYDLPVPTDVASLMGWNRLAAGVSHSDAPDSAPTPDVMASEVEEERLSDDAFMYKSSRVEEPPAQESEPQGQEPVQATADVQQEESAEPVQPVPPQTNKQHERILEVEANFEQLARKLKKPGVGRADGRFPMYVIFTTKSGLVKQFGAQTETVIEGELGRLATAIRRKIGWGAAIFMPDDPLSTRIYGMDPVDAIDPWKLKLSLVDLDQMLAKKGEMIAALLIVGGPEIVPFHSLPNPTDDMDTEVLSDNPYATLDANYFMPSWPVGRFPSETGPDAGLLLTEIRQATHYYESGTKRPAWWGSFLAWIRLPDSSSSISNGPIKGKNVGITAAIWQRSSLAAFRPIGEGNRLLVCPPETSDTADMNKIMNAPLGYFNLHGLEDGGEWYGQRDPLDGSSVVDYPVAIKPADLMKNGRVPQVIFSEACYGANINKKSQDDSMALRFASLGTLTLVGSTCIAYGSINTPLIGADLLGSLFWKYLQSGRFVGDALMQAKVDLAREMGKRQGYLDGEDQKTLISFVLYGDPLLQMVNKPSQAKNVLRMREQVGVKTVCDNDTDDGNGKLVSGAVLSEVKALLESYLPGLETADIHINAQHEVCNSGSHRCPTHELGEKVRYPKKTHNVVVTFSKQYTQAQHTHTHYARVTLDSHGKMVKLAISR